MELFAQFGYSDAAAVSSTAYYVYGMVMLMMSAWLALNLERPEKEN